MPSGADALDRMLDRWRDWKSGTGANGLGYGRSSLDPERLDPVDGSTVGQLGPPLGAFELERAIAALPARMRNALSLEYLSPNLTQAVKAAALGVGSRQAYVRAVSEAKARLEARVRNLRRIQARRAKVKNG